MCYAHINPNIKNKHADTAVKGQFVGYSVERRAYKVLLPGDKLIISRTVTFDEGRHVEAVVTGNRLSQDQNIKHQQQSHSSDDESDEEVTHPPAAATISRTPLPAGTPPLQLVWGGPSLRRSSLPNPFYNNRFKLAT
jgi:hypothetical protein